MLLATLLTATDSCAVAVEFRVPSPLGHELAAVLETRDPAQRLPTVVLVSGAGPHDRNGYTIATSRGTNEAFRVLSGRLTARGFAVVRFDEMGTGSSSGDYRQHATTATLAADVSAIVVELRRRPAVDGARIVLVGFSEGGAIAGIVGAADSLLGGIVLLSSPAWTGQRIMRYQDSIALADAYITDAAVRARVRVRLDSVDFERRSTESWYPFFLRYDPLPAYQRLRVPVLIIHGAQDQRVSVDQAGEIDEHIRTAGNAQVELHTFPGLGHALTELEWSATPDSLSGRVTSTLERWLIRTQGATTGGEACRVKRSPEASARGST